MTATIIDGKEVARRHRQRIAREVERLKGTHGIVPTLAAVLVGDDPGSKVYVGMKEKSCAALGIGSEVHRLPADIGQEGLLELIASLNARPEIHGILIQFPLPKGYDRGAVVEAVDPSKDVDGFHPFNLGRLLASGKGEGRPPLFVACTPAGVMALIREAGVDPAGKEAVVLGRSVIVGKPVAALLLAADATVTICHSRTADIAAVTRRAEILVAAVGRPRMITAGMVRPGAIVIDVGTNRLPDGSLCGDVDFDAVSEVAGAISPSPGGVGPMTITMLLFNTLRSAFLTVGEDLAP
jgi:methylenetetrahydrofolate dehydrogenase (NADP+)/methenyltetrahydrofolate cyclohydrolase